MLKAAKAIDENIRLQALRDWLILDTLPAERFDRMSKFVRFEFDVPMMPISLIDAERQWLKSVRQWLKSVVAASACSSARELSFCAHAIG